MSQNSAFHSEPFDEGTLIKLKIFKSYFSECLPVFIKMRSVTKINYYDFFCGPGTDGSGEKGSPLLALDVANEYADQLNEAQKELAYYFCDENNEKVETLKDIIRAEHGYIKDIVQIRFDKKDFSDAIKENYNDMLPSNVANYLFIDPFGFEVTIDIFKMIIRLSKTDFIMFIPSSFANRFKEHETVKKYLPGFNADGIEDSDFANKYICDYYRDVVKGEKSKFLLTQFSIKKGSNVYGLIFGTGDLLGLQKFLNICWKIDPRAGESNFNMYNDIPIGGMLLLSDDFYSKRMNMFKSDLENKITGKSLITNEDIYKYTLFSGFLPAHARDIMNDLVRRNILAKKVVLSYDSIYKNKKIERVKLV